jgi:hypothetical protein
VGLKYYLKEVTKMKDEIMELILSDVDPAPPTALSDEESEQVHKLVRDEIRPIITTFKSRVKKGDTAHAVFKFESPTKTSIIRALEQAKTFPGDSSKMRQAAVFITGLLRDYEWSTRNAPLINRVRIALSNLAPAGENQ